MDDTERAALGITIRDTTKSPINAPEVPPEVEAEPFGPQEVRVHFWSPDSSAPGRRGKAPGARACRLIGAVVDVGQPAPPATEMTFVADDTSTPNNPTFDPEDIGKTFWVRGAWVSPRGELGPFSEPSSVTIPG